MEQQILFNSFFTVLDLPESSPFTSTQLVLLFMANTKFRDAISRKDHHLPFSSFCFVFFFFFLLSVSFFLPKQVLWKWEGERVHQIKKYKKWWGSQQKSSLSLSLSLSASKMEKENKKYKRWWGSQQISLSLSNQV
jgi:hypothetical protein